MADEPQPSESLEDHSDKRPVRLSLDALRAQSGTDATVHVMEVEGGEDAADEEEKSKAPDDAASQSSADHSSLQQAGF